MSLRVDVRPLAAAEIPAVERDLPGPNPEAHVSRFSEQRAGLTSYLIAWLGDRAVGHVVVRWRGAGSRELLDRAGQLAPHPLVEALMVIPALRSQSIGSQVMAVAEVEAIRRGHAWIGLAVGVENARAHALYVRLGYRDAGLGEFPNRWSYRRRDGQVVVAVEQCRYLLKGLPARAAGEVEGRLSP